MSELDGRTVATISAIVPRSGYIQVDEKKCLACRECEVACSLFHEQQCSPSLASIQIDFDDFRPGFPDLRVCKQCDYPACYYACLAKHPDDPPMAIDQATGARYIDQAKCNGCRACLRACPLTPERPVIFQKTLTEPDQARTRKVYLKCDLCKDRQAGPVCVQICPGGALSYVPASRRRG